MLYCSAFAFETPIETLQSVWVSTYGHVLKVINKKHLVNVILFAVITSHGDIMLSFIFLHSITRNTETHIECLFDLALAWVKWLAVGKDSVWSRTLHHDKGNKRTHASRSNNFCLKINLWRYKYTNNDLQAWWGNKYKGKSRHDYLYI